MSNAPLERAVVVAGGWAHPPEDMLDAMQDLLVGRVGAVDHRDRTINAHRRA